MKRITPGLAIALVCALIFVTTVSALVGNGNFETGTFSSWTKSTYINNGFTAPRAVGGSDLSTVVGGPAVAPLSLSDPRTNGALMYPAYGKYTARVNSELSYAGGGFGQNGNMITQTVPAYIDPSDNKAHIRFTYAAVMVNPTSSPHSVEQKPYFRVRAINTSNGNAVLYDFSSYVDEPGKNWQNGATFGSGGEFWKYLNWTAIDLTPTAANPVNAGDNVMLEVTAAGCSPSGHPGYVYIDEITDNEITGPTVRATGPATAATGSTLTYTYNYRNGASVPVNATVRATQPTGVNFTSVSDPTNCPLAAGTVTCNFNGVPASGGSGSFTVSGTVTAAGGSQIAHGAYEISATGFPTLGGQTVLTSVPVAVPTSTGVASSANPSRFGQNVVFTANVTSGSGTPTGNVQFVVDGANFGSPVALSSGSAQVNTSALGVGNHPVTANFIGNVNFSASSGQLTGGQTVNQSNTTVGVSSSVNPSLSGQSVTFTANVTATAPGAGTPTGNVTFTVDGAVLCAAASLSGGNATCGTSTLAPGNHPVSVTYNGDTNFNTGNGSLTGGQNVNKANTTLGLTSPVNPSVSGQPITVTAAVTPVAPGAGTPTGTITFFVDGVAACTNVTMSAASASCLIPSLAAGNRVITATYGGSTVFNGSNGTLSPVQAVNKANTTTGVVSSPNPSVAGQAVTLTATVAPVAPGTGTPTGTVTFRVDGNVTCSTATLTGAFATCGVASLGAGGHAVTADYNGDANFNTSNGSGTHTVNKANTTVGVASAPNPSVSGQSITLTATVVAAAPGTGTPTGTVTFRVDGNATCTAVVLSSGSATCSVPSLSAGGHSVSVDYNGDANFNTSNGSGTHTVNRADTTVGVTSAPNPSVSGQAITLTATVAAVAPGAGTPTGTVAFSVDGNVVCASAALTGAVATCAVPSLNAGGHALAVTYGGNVNFNGSNGTGTHVVNPANTTLGLVSSVNPSVAGQPVRITATVVPVSPGSGTPTGTVTFFVNGTPVCVNVPMVNAVAVCDLPPLGAGDYEITSTYGGDPNFNPSGGSLTPRQTVGKASTALGLVSSLNPSIYGQQVTFTAAVAAVAPGSGTPTGTISFFADGVSLCAGVTTTAATAACSVSSLVAGNHGITAQYSGDANFNTASGTLTGNPQVVAKADTTTVIANAAALGTPTGAGQTYPVTWTTTPVAPGAGVLTGSVTVRDGNAVCVAAVAVGTCNLTSTTSGPKSITATYGGDANFNPSTSAAVPHDVTTTISGRVFKSNAPAMDTPLTGVVVSLTGGSEQSATTDANGNYAFYGLTGGVGYVVTPTGLGMTYEATSRSYPNLTSNVFNADFMAFTAAQMERGLIVGNAYTVSGQPASVPVTMKAKGNEASMAFSFAYDTTYLSMPVVACGASAPGCNVAFDTGTPGVVGMKITPVAPLAEGAREIAMITFQTAISAQSNTGLVFGQVPMASLITDFNGNPLVSRYTNGYVVFQQGLEGDLAGRFAGDGILRSKDVEMMRRFATGDLINVAFNEFQRADVSPYQTSGDGRIDATDFQLVKNYVAQLVVGKPASGPMVAAPFGQAAPSDNKAESATRRSIRVVSASAVSGGKATITIEIDALGDESAALFSLDFDPAKLSNPQVSLGGELQLNTHLTANTDAAPDGRLTMLLDSSDPFTSSVTQAVTITFDVAKEAPIGATYLNFAGSGSFSDASGRFLEANYKDGVVNIGGRTIEVSLEPQQ